MVTKQLIAFIKEQQSTGKTMQQITDLLSQNGWKPVDITAGFDQVKTGVPTPSTTARPAGQLPGVFDLLTQSWSLFVKRWQTFFGIMAFQILAGVALIIIFVAGGFATFFASGMGSSTAGPDTIKLGVTGFSLALMILALVAIGLLSFLCMIATYHVVCFESEVGVKKAFRYAWSKLGSFLWISILTTMVTAGGILLLYVPGIIAATAITFAMFVLITEDARGLNALVRSWQYVYGHWWAVFWRILAFSLIVALASGILSAISAGLLGSLVGIIVTPISAAYTYLLFVNLKALPRDPQALSKPNGHFKVFAVLGILTVIGFIVLIATLLTVATTNVIS